MICRGEGSGAWRTFPIIFFPPSSETAILRVGHCYLSCNVSKESVLESFWGGSKSIPCRFKWYAKGLNLHRNWINVLIYFPQSPSLFLGYMYKWPPYVFSNCTQKVGTCGNKRYSTPSPPILHNVREYWRLPFIIINNFLFYCSAVLVKPTFRTEEGRVSFPVSLRGGWGADKELGGDGCWTGF